MADERIGRVLALWSGLLTAAVVASCHTTTPPVTAPSESPQTALEAWAAAFRAGDAEDMTSRYERSNDVVIIHSDGRTSRGIDAVRSDCESAFREVVFEKASLQPSGVWEVGGVAWATGRFSATTRRKSDNSAWILEMNTSFVLRAFSGSWKIALEQSTPIAGVPRVRPAE
jgi:ketosteroid isomerase-like protein